MMSARTPKIVCDKLAAAAGAVYPRLAKLALATACAAGLGESRGWAQNEASASDTRSAASPAETAPVPTPVAAEELPTADPAPRRVNNNQVDNSQVGNAPTSGSQPSAGTTPDATSRNLQSIVSQAIQSLDASKIPNLEKAKQDLSAAVSKLENFLDLSSANGQAWSKFLKLETLKQELQSERPNLDTMVSLDLNMRQNYQGLELTPYLQVRQKIGDVVRALRYGYAPDKAVEQLEVKLQQLIETLEEPVQGAGTDRSFAVGLIANYLHEMNQAPQAVSQIHQQFSIPNVQLYARENLINRVIMRPVAEPNAVNECLLGTRIVGQACLSGMVSADLQPMMGGVALHLNLNASLTTNSNGYNRGVVLGSTSYSPVYASKAIYVTPNGISSTPANIATDLQTSINSIDHKLRIVRRIAQRKAAEQKPLADAIAEGRMQDRVRSQYDQQVEQQLAEARTQLGEVQGRTPPELARVGVSMPTYSFNSDSVSVQGHVKQAAPFQLAAFKSSTFSKPTDSDVVVEAHQSAVVNALDIALSDRTIRSADLDDYARQLTGKVSAEVQEEADGEPWSITLATYRPVEIELDDSKVKLVLRVTRMTRGDQTLEDSAFVTAVYAPSYSKGVLTLNRQGEVEVTFARASRGLRVVTLRSFLKGKFDKFFKEQLVTQPLDLPARFPNLPKIALNVMKIDDGWLQLGWR